MLIYHYICSKSKHPESKYMNISLYLEKICSGMMEMPMFHYTYTKSSLRRAKMLIFYYMCSTKTFWNGGNVDISLYV